MSGSSTNATQPPRAAEQPRLSREGRRDALLDAARELVIHADVEAVSMESVAELAGVSRPLVYKHFANRGELLAAVYRREAETLHEELSAEAGAAGSLEEMYRALLRGSLRAASERGAVFTSLRAAGALNRELRMEQRSRERGNVRAFTTRAVRERHLDRDAAMVATAVVLGAIDTVISQWCRRPTRENGRLLEEVFMRMMRAAYEAVPLATPVAVGG